MPEVGVVVSLSSIVHVDCCRLSLSGLVSFLAPLSPVTHA